MPSCKAYNSPYIDFIFPTSFESYYAIYGKLCTSIDILMLFSVILSRICLYLFLLYLSRSFFESEKVDNTVKMFDFLNSAENKGKIYDNKLMMKYLEHLFIVTIIINVLSLFIILTKTPKYKERTDTEEITEIKNIS